jgi:RHS repeat-associated protein
MGADDVHVQDAMDQLSQRANGTTPWSALSAREYIPGPNPDERLDLIDTTGGVYSLHVNMQGTLVALGQGSGPVLKIATGPWGESASTVPTGIGPSAYPYRYTGQRQDPFVPSLYNYKVRSYIPGMARFLQPDPTGAKAGPNLYAYAEDDPITTLTQAGI